MSVVMPCLNEARTVGLCVSKAIRALQEMGVAGEVIVADNGSTDGSQPVQGGHPAGGHALASPLSRQPRADRTFEPVLPGRFGDAHCGLRAFRRDAYERLSLVTTGMEFASEMVVKAALRGLRIGEVPVVLHPDGRDRRPHLRSFRDGWRHLRFLLLFCPLWLFLLPARSGARPARCRCGE